MTVRPSIAVGRRRTVEAPAPAVRRLGPRNKPVGDLPLQPRQLAGFARRRQKFLKIDKTSIFTTCQKRH